MVMRFGPSTGGVSEVGGGSELDRGEGFRGWCSWVCECCPGRGLVWMVQRSKWYRFEEVVTKLSMAGKGSGDWA